MPADEIKQNPDGNRISQDSSEQSSKKDISIKLPQQLINVIKTLPEEEQKIVKAMFMAVSVKQSSFRGPLPPPDILIGYNEAIPNGAERILKMAEDQAAHRMALEKTIINEQQRQASKGQNLGFTIGVMGLLIAGFCAYCGHDIVGGVIGTVDLVGLVGLFVIGRYRQGNDLEAKNDS